MTYTAQSRTSPNGTQDGPGVVGSALANDKALQDQILSGLGQGWTYSQSGGTAEQPAQFLCTNVADTNTILKAELTWSTYKLTGVTFSLSTNGGSAYDAIGSPLAVTWDGDYNITASTGWAGIFLKFALEISAKFKALRNTESVHEASTTAHGIGTIASQSAASVNLDGGAIDGTTIGGTTPAAGTFTRAMEVRQSASFAAGTVNLDWSLSGSGVFTASGSGAASITFSGLPASGIAQQFVVTGINMGLRSSWTWPTNTRWDGGTAPTGLPASGRTVIAFFTDDGGANLIASVVATNAS